MATKFSKEELAKAFIQQGGIEAEDSIVEYYDIMIIGRTGMGKSTTADKLVIANLTNCDYRGEAYDEETVEGGRMTTSDLSMWLTSDAEGEMKRVTWRLKDLVLFRCLDNPHKEVNDFYRKQSKQTMQSQLISNETTMVRVLDVAGFFESLNPSANVMREVLHIQVAMRMDFKRILYFIPERGSLETSHKILRMELEQMVHFFGKSIFDCMVLIATVNPDVYQYIPPDIVPFSREAEMKIRTKFQEALDLVLPPGEQLPDQKPPIVFISMNDTCEDIYANIKDAPVIYNGMRLSYKHGVCDHCGLKTKFLEVGEEIVKIACYAVDPSCCVPYKESVCHPMFISKYSGITKLFGQIYRTLTRKRPDFHNPDDKICINCGKIPLESGCMQVGTYYTVENNKRLLVDHEVFATDVDETFHAADLDKTFAIVVDDDDLEQRHRDLIAIEPDEPWRAQISFLHKEILKCDHSGLQYSIESYGITLEVPRGSVAMGKEIHMEIGVTLCGPFSFPRGTRSISPIVSLQLLGENMLTESFEFHVILRHILGELTELKARHHQVQFCCNDHVSSHPGTYKFHLNDDGFISQSFTDSYHGRVITKKFCILCMTAADTPEVQSEIGYRLTRIVCTSELKNEAYLCLSYDAYLQAMKKQFPQEDDYVLNTLNRLTFTNFSARLQFIPEDNDNCTLTMDQTGIWVSDVDILKSMSEAIFAYPPRVKIDVNLKDNVDVVRVQINVRGSSNDEEVRIDLSFPFKDAEELRHINAVQNAMESKGILDHTIVQGVFVGLARSGKDSLMKRLLGKKLSSTSPSTGVAENTVQVKVMTKSTTVAANIEESYWTEMDYDDEAIKLMSISIHNKIASPKQLKQLPIRYQEGILIEASVTMPVHSIESASLSTSSADGGDHHETSTTKAQGRRVPTVQAPPFSSKTIHRPLAVFPVPNPTDILKGALRSKGLQALKQHFQKTWSLYLTNTGGQMEFQEVLPLLVSGPSVFFFTFRLDRDLNEHYSVEYELATGGRSYPYTTTCTTLEGILQTLASISAMGTFVYHDLQKRKAPLRPKVFFIGTHKDELKPALAVTEKLKSIDRQLKEVIESTSHYKELVEYASPSQLMFTVNNLSESDSDFQNIRSAVERVVMRGEFQMSSPAHWLVFSLALRKLDFHVVNYDHCFNIAKRCGITTQEEFDEALHFIHSKMGMIRYFPYENIKDLVIIDPQFLFDKVTELIVDTFTFEKAGKSKMDEFKHKGIFSMDEFELINAENHLEITTSQLGDLLVHLRIAAPFQINGEKKLFLPCVLAHAKISTKASQLSTPVSSLLIVFDCGYVPKGVPGALIKYLMTNEMKSPSEWVLLTDEIFKDQISFNVGPYDVIVLEIFPTHFEINCIPDEKFMVDRTSPIEDTCDEILNAINVGIRQILEDLNYINCQHRLTIQCQDSDCKFKHKTQVCRDKSGHSGTVCCQITKNRFNFPSNSYFWGFGKKPHQELGTNNVVTQPSSTSPYTQIASVQPHQTTSYNIVHPLMDSTELQSVTLLEKVTDIPRTSSGIDSPVPLGEAHHLVIFEQLQKHSSDWMKIGTYLGFYPNELRKIQNSPSLFFSGPDVCLSTLLEKWLQWAPGDRRGSKKFATLENLKLALSKAGFGATAHTLHI